MAAAAAACTSLPRAEDDPLEGGESEEEEEVESDEEDGSEPANLADLYEPDAGSDEDPSFDPDADMGGPEGEAALWSGMARLSISARKGRLVLNSVLDPGRFPSLQIIILYEFCKLQERICSSAEDGK
jgi:hypothetical protein